MCLLKQIRSRTYHVALFTFKLFYLSLGLSQIQELHLVVFKRLFSLDRDGSLRLVS